MRSVSGAAFGCLDFVHSACVEVGNTVVVTKRYLDPQDPRSLHCEAEAAEIWVDGAVFPRCDALTGTTSSCVGLEATEAPYPREDAGMVSL